jgi:F0F1-type ATP synthase assembly protein I
MALRDGGGEYLKGTWLGFEFAGVMLMFTYLGYLADRRWHWEPWGLLSGVGLGLTGGMYWLIKESLRMTRDAERRDAEDRGQPDQHQSGKDPERRD